MELGEKVIQDAVLGGPSVLDALLAHKLMCAAHRAASKPHLVRAVVVLCFCFVPAAAGDGPADERMFAYMRKEGAVPLTFVIVLSEAALPHI